MGRRRDSKRDNGTGAIYKDGQGYRVQVLVEDSLGRKHTKKRRAKSHEEAVSLLNRLNSENYLGRLVPSNQQTVEAYLKRWVETTVKPHLADNTYRQYAWLIRVHIVPTLGSMRLDQLKRTDVNRLLAAKAKQRVSSRAKKKVETDRNLSHSTLRLIRAVILAALEDAVKDNLIGQNPSSHVKLPKAPQRSAEFLSPDDARKLYEASSDSPVGALIRFLLQTGVRIGEATGVRWQDIRGESSEVHICGQLQRLDKQLTYVTRTKANQERVLTLPSELLNELTEMKATRDADGISDPDNLVFLSPIGARLDPKYVRNHLAACCVNAGVKVMSPHKLRHTAATMALSETGDLHAVQKWLGHQQSSLTANLYGHSTRKGMKRVSVAVGKGLSPVSSAGSGTSSQVNSVVQANPA